MSLRFLTQLLVRDPRAVGRLGAHLPSLIRMYWRLFNDPRVHPVAKAVLAAGVLYVLIPFDLVPVFPFIAVGWIDDVIVFLVCTWLFIRLCPAAVVQEHVRLIDQGG